MLEINGKFADGLGSMYGSHCLGNLCGAETKSSIVSYVRLWRVPESIVLDCRLPSEKDDV